MIIFYPDPLYSMNVDFFAICMNNNTKEEHSANLEYRKVQGHVGELSFSVVLPKSYAVHLGIGKGDFVKVTQEQNRIVIEKA